MYIFHKNKIFSGRFNQLPAIIVNLMYYEKLQNICIYKFEIKIYFYNQFSFLMMKFKVISKKKHC